MKHRDDLGPIIVTAAILAVVVVTLGAYLIWGELF